MHFSKVNSATKVNEPKFVIYTFDKSTQTKNFSKSLKGLSKSFSKLLLSSIQNNHDILQDTHNA